MFTHKLHTLSSGLTVITVPMASVDSITVLAMANTGSRYEEPRIEGIAHFFEHMVFKGTANYPDSQTLALAIDRIGADFNAFTSKEYTGYYVKAASKHVERALDVVSDMLLTPKLSQEDIDREKGVIIEEINMYRDTPTRYIADLFEEMLFKGSGLSHDVAGSKESVTGVNRQDFVSFLKQWYGLGNLVVVLAGHAKTVESDKTLKLIETAFGKDGGERAQHKVKITPYMGAGKNSEPFSSVRLHVEHKPTEQAHLIMGWPGVKRSDERRYALTVLGTVLGGNMSSRLFTEVREKRGLCYYVRSDVDYYHDGGIFGASAGVDPKRIDEALKVMKEEFLALASGERAVTATELADAKENIVGSTVLGFEDSRSVAQYFGLKQTLSNVTESPDELIRKIMAVTLKEVNELAALLVKPGAMRLAVIGPYKDKTQFEHWVE